MHQWFLWLSMGGYGNYVWSAYGCLTVILVGNSIYSYFQRNMILKKLRYWYQSKRQ